MKRFFILSLILGAMAFVVPTAEAKTTSAIRAAPQVSIQIGRRNRPVRVVTRTRITRVGPYRYRETIRTTYFRNGRTRTQVISRVRLGRWRNY